MRFPYKFKITIPSIKGQFLWKENFFHIQMTKQKLRLVMT